MTTQSWSAWSPDVSAAESTTSGRTPSGNDASIRPDTVSAATSYAPDIVSPIRPLVQFARTGPWASRRTIRPLRLVTSAPPHRAMSTLPLVETTRQSPSACPISIRPLDDRASTDRAWATVIRPDLVTADTAPTRPSTLIPPDVDPITSEVCSGTRTTTLELPLSIVGDELATETGPVDEEISRRPGSAITCTPPLVVLMRRVSTADGAGQDMT